jgi:hypothetical protein
MSTWLALAARAAHPRTRWLLGAITPGITALQLLISPGVLYALRGHCFIGGATFTWIHPAFPSGSWDVPLWIWLFPPGSIVPTGTAASVLGPHSPAIGPLLCYVLPAWCAVQFHWGTGRGITRRAGEPAETLQTRAFLIRVGQVMLCFWLASVAAALGTYALLRIASVAVAPEVVSSCSPALVLRPEWLIVAFLNGAAGTLLGRTLRGPAWIAAVITLMASIGWTATFLYAQARW